jgi:hypothetical protein
MLELLAVAGRSAHVRGRDGVAAREEKLRDRAEALREERPPLGLRSTVHGDHDGVRAFSVRLEQEERDLLAVEARQSVQLGLDACDRPVTGEAPELTRVEFVAMRLQRLERAREGEPETRPVAGEARIGDDAAARERHLASPLERDRVAQLQPRPALLVLEHEQRAARIVDRAFEVPLRLEHHPPLARAEVVTGEGAGVAERVRRGEEAGGVGQPAGRGVLRRSFVRRGVHNLAALDVEEKQVGVARQLPEPLGDDEPSVRRERVHSEVAAQVERQLVAAVEPPDDHLEVASVAAIRRVGEQGPVARDDGRPVVEARVDHERLGLAAPFQQIELRPLVAALVHGEESAAVRKQRPVDRLRQIRQLLQVAAVRSDEEELPRSRQVGRDQQLGAVRGERERPRLRQLEKLPERARQRPGRARG